MRIAINAVDSVLVGFGPASPPRRRARCGTAFVEAGDHLAPPRIVDGFDSRGEAIARAVHRCARGDTLASHRAIDAVRLLVFRGVRRGHDVYHPIGLRGALDNRRLRIQLVLGSVREDDTGRIPGR